MCGTGCGVSMVCVFVSWALECLRISGLPMSSSNESIFLLSSMSAYETIVPGVAPGVEWTEWEVPGAGMLPEKEERNASNAVVPDVVPGVGGRSDKEEKRDTSYAGRVPVLGVVPGVVIFFEMSLLLLSWRVVSSLEFVSLVFASMCLHLEGCTCRSSSDV